GKKEKKEKKKKKSKLEEKLAAAAALAASSASDAVDPSPPAEETEEERKARKAARKAMKENETEEERKIRKKREKAEKKAREKAEAVEAEQAEGAEGAEGEEQGGDAEEEEKEEYYGAPDEAVWSDKSAAILEAERRAKDGEDKVPTHGKDGKKLSNKERKKLMKARDAADREAEYLKAEMAKSAAGGQFACSQSAINKNDPQWSNSLDVIIPSFNISAAGKVLFQDASFSVVHGRRYGLVGPNGKGKSTLLKMVASGDLQLPPRVDFLYVEQEVVADDTRAVDAVLKADKKRWELLEEEKELTRRVDSGEEDDKISNRLAAVYEELNNIGADGAEAKARRILYGLGFD
ncbi:hypothetical protein TrRE_jg3405, partial [Triparma retinervis]